MENGAEKIGEPVAPASSHLPHAYLMKRQHQSAPEKAVNYEAKEEPSQALKRL